MLFPSDLGGFSCKKTGSVALKEEALVTMTSFSDGALAGTAMLLVRAKADGFLAFGRIMRNLLTVNGVPKLKGGHHNNTLVVVGSDGILTSVANVIYIYKDSLVCKPITEGKMVATQRQA